MIMKASIQLDIFTFTAHFFRVVTFHFTGSPLQTFNSSSTVYVLSLRCCYMAFFLYKLQPSLNKFVPIFPCRTCPPIVLLLCSIMLKCIYIKDRDVFFFPMLSWVCASGAWKYKIINYLHRTGQERHTNYPGHFL